MKAKVYTGTASWTDPGFVADWYPKGLRPADRLCWYAAHFSLVEVNSSFYAVPRIENVENWCRQTPDNFIFNVKAHKLLSRHSVSPKFLPSALRQLASVRKEKVIPDSRLESAVARALVESIRPLCDAGKMGAILVQFSPAFRPKTNRLAEMDVFLEWFEGLKTAVELRNRDWVTGDCLERTVKYFKKRKLVLVSVDAPESPHFPERSDSSSVVLFHGVEFDLLLIFAQSPKAYGKQFWSFVPHHHLGGEPWRRGGSGH